MPIENFRVMGAFGLLIPVAVLTILVFYRGRYLNGDSLQRPSSSA